MATKETPQPEPEKQEIKPHFELLASPPPGHKIEEVQIYNVYIGQKINEAFKEHGFPKPEEYIAVTRTLRAVFGGQYFDEKKEWEESYGVKLPPVAIGVKSQ